MKKALVVLFLVLLTVMGYSGTASAIIVQSEGSPSSKKAPLEVRKQEAFIVAFFDGIRKIVEEAEWLPPTTDEKTGNLVSAYRKRVGGFKIDSRTVIKEVDLLADLIVVEYRGQKITIKDFQLQSPAVKSVKLPKWNRLPKKISGIEITDAKWDDEKEIFTIELVYPYSPFDGLIIDAREQNFRPALINRILSDKDYEVYNPKSVKQDALMLLYGTGEYADSIEKVKAMLLSRGVKNPLMITAKGVKSDNAADIVISDRDAVNIIEMNRYGRFLDKAKVGFVVDLRTR